MRNRGHVYAEIVGPEGAGLTVLAYFVKRWTHSDEATWQARIEGGEVALAGRRALETDRLVAGVSLAWSRPPWDEPEAPRHYEVLFEDDDLLAVAKPSGLPTLPGGGFLENTLLAAVRDVHPDASPMHRLGRGTSGLVLFAKSERARQALARDLRERRIRKIYRALASGRMSTDTCEITMPIGPVKHPKLGTLEAASPTGKRSLSRVFFVEHRADGTLVDVEIETGRPHQIRIHLASIGHPLVGDPLYGPGGLPHDLDALPGDLGYHLHARRLELTHPGSGRLVVIEAPLPGMLRALSDANG